MADALDDFVHELQEKIYDDAKDRKIFGAEKK